ncbi:MAG TPA: hypothetical protein VH877_15955 [Polyangia bacterium]|jgi:hypothetical protein|nr:hypothetical protein [Polyangia bacterium]
MHLRSVLPSLSLLSALALAGCGSSNPASISQDQFYEQLPATLCSYYVACGSIGRSEEASCRTRPATVDNIFSPLPSTLYRDGVAAGRLRFDGVAAQKCLDYYRAGRCYQDGDNYDDSRACRRVYRPLVADGGTCMLPTDCRSGTCNTSGGPGCPGVCAPSNGCNRLNCSEDEFCNQSTPQCTPRRGPGVRCDDPTDYDACQPGLVCINGACNVPERAGGACGSGLGLCAAGFRCDIGASSCQATLPAGSACRRSEDCLKGLLCVSPTSTGTDGVCRPVLDVPSDCDPDLATAASVCPLSSYCDSTTRRCVQRLQTGASCATANCPSGMGLYCDEATLTCQELVRLGSTCTPPSSADPSRNPCGPIALCDATTRKCTAICQ